jgi:hypothetical protein
VLIQSRADGDAGDSDSVGNVIGDSDGVGDSDHSSQST